MIDWNVDQIRSILLCLQNSNDPKDIEYVKQLKILLENKLRD